MKRVIVSLMVVVGALVSACTAQEESIPAAGLSGTYDVVLVRDLARDAEGNLVVGDQLVFVTSTDRNELRVLDLQADSSKRGYIRAPNPLEALAIPVLERPQALAHDVSYDATGTDMGGPYVYARSNGSTRISVVASERSLLREVMQLPTNELTLATGERASTGPVTAFAARGPGESGMSTLYYTTQETTGAVLWELQLPEPGVLANLDPASLHPVRLTKPELPANVAVSSLLVMPQAGQLVVATRSTAGSAPGKTYKANLLDGSVLELDFRGQQVLQLATHGRVTYVQDEVTKTLEAGAQIFGILDPSNCGSGASQCATGVLAVDANTGKVRKDSSSVDAQGNPVYDMLPIQYGGGLPTGLSLAANVYVASVGEVALLGIVSLSSGQLLLFDAVGLRVIDVDAVDAEFQSSRVSAQGVSSSTSDVTVEVTNGVTTNETYSLTYQGILPGMDNLERNLATPLEFDVPGPQAQPGDLIILFPEQTGGQPCATELAVSTVLPSPDPLKPNARRLTTTSDIPAECAGYTRFLVRAAGSQPLVLASSSAGFIQRLGLSDSYTRTGSYFFHPTGYTGATEGVNVRITVSNPRATGLARGDRYVVSTLSRYFPYTVVMDTSINQLQLFLLPGPVVQADVGGTDYAYIVYPSAEGVLQVNLQQVSPAVANSGALYPYQ